MKNRGWLGWWGSMGNITGVSEDSEKAQVHDGIIWECYFGTTFTFRVMDGWLNWTCFLIPTQLQAQAAAHRQLQL